MQLLLLLFVVVVINLFGSCWLLSVSVLEVKASDWVMSQRPSAPEPTDAGAVGSVLVSVSLAADGRHVSQSECFRTKTLVDQSQTPPTSLPVTSR